MTTLLLKLAGPLQAWGDSSRYGRRETRSAPTKSGVLGLLAAAEGRRRTDPLEDLAHLRFGVRTDQPGVLTRDFQTAIRWSDGTAMPLSSRYYLADAIFVAAVEGDDALIDGLVQALRRPQFPLYLGRRSCPTSDPVYFGVSSRPVAEALREAEWQAKDWHRRKLARTVMLPIQVDALPGVRGEAVHDVPVSFDSTRRQYGWRDVVSDAVEVDNPLGHDDMDFMSVLGG